MSSWQELYTPHRTQKEFHSIPWGTVHTKLLMAGRRWGKSRASVVEGLATIGEIAKMPFIDPVTKADLTNTLLPPIHVWVVVPTYAQASQLIEEYVAMTPNHMVIREKKKAVTGQEDRTLRLLMQSKKGSLLPGVVRPEAKIEFKSADRDWGLISVGLDFVHVSEAQNVKESAWNVLRPTLKSPGRAGRAVIEGSAPFTPSHWFANMFTTARRLEGYSCSHYTSFENPLLTASDLKKIQEEKEVGSLIEWERQYLARVSSDQGGFFRNIDTQAIAEELPSPIFGRRYVAGLDVGRVDDTVMIVKDAQSRHSVAVLEMRGTSWETQLDRIERFGNEWKPEIITMDSHGMGNDILYEQLSNRGLPLIAQKFSMQEKRNLYENYAGALEQGTTGYPDSWFKLKYQLGSIIFKRTASGGTVLQPEAENGNDDWVDAECMALKGCDPVDIYEKPRYDETVRWNRIPAVRRTEASRKVARKRKKDRRSNFFQKYMDYHYPEAPDADRDVFVEQLAYGS